MVLKYLAMSDNASALQRKIEGRQTQVTVMGLGYVGLPLAVEFARAGFKTIGYDPDSKKVDSLNRSVSYISDVPSESLEEVEGNFSATTDPDCLKGADVVVICVPTPLRKTRDPDLSFVISAVEILIPRLHDNMLVVLESTTYPGSTEELLAKRIEGCGFEVGKDIFVAFSPERVDPANPVYKTRDIPKVVGGITPQCGEIASSLYEAVVGQVYRVSSARTAEMVKLLENTFRSVNIGLVNEIAMICHKMGIDVWEVIESAKTKPFGFMAFYPGPGIGGHCIPCDPLYLTWKARDYGIEPRLVELASQINYYMPHYVLDRLTDILNEEGLALSRSRILVLGVAYKKNVSDTRESPAIELMNLLLEKRARVDFYDPWVEEIRTSVGPMRGISDLSAVGDYDCVLLTTDHDNVDYDFVVANAKLIFDTRGRLRGKGEKVRVL